MKHGHGTSDVQNDHEANSISMIASNQHLHVFTCSGGNVQEYVVKHVILYMYYMYREQVRRWIKLFRWPMTTKQDVHVHSCYDQHFVQAHPKGRLSCLPGVANRSNRMMRSLYLD